MNHLYRRPAYLNSGDKICITSPAGRVAPEKVLKADKVFKNYGFEVEIMSHALGAFYQFSGTDDERLEDLQQALDDPYCKAILMSRGGYGLHRIIDRLDFRSFETFPKWIIGFSDITLLHAHLHCLKWQSLHSPMASAFSIENPSQALKVLSFLQGNLPKYSLAPHALNRKGKARGILTGGNLSILTSILGSCSDLDTNEKILFIEDVGEYLYRLDRMMWTYKRAGKLSHLSGLIIGGLTEMKDGETNFGYSAEEIVYQAVKQYSYPVCFGFPAGHQPHNEPLMLGAEIRIEITDEGTEMIYLY
ncbi:MAG TPA: LD-carboxypeptidase [Bacteroidales bacterium]|jgi:muramoyltetrapeptide carboxypeptidase|nr:LD-carboxypeptidase [Bacteroidales bacterium]HNV17327.1 LD-carboxypeptidase [Bacteroidales bacterium]HOC15791.1 LD-carboxypeptidase [Bacteroidales bacterium]HOX79654.1 LD-carboxypeptidase [Bacteroidales bacterium]HPN49178.1 LD-carboxypeptidase [Bacteroidales bacterium]